MSEPHWIRAGDVFINVDEMAAVFKTEKPPGADDRVTAIVFKNNPNTQYFSEGLFEKMAGHFKPDATL